MHIKSLLFALTIISFLASCTTKNKNERQKESASTIHQPSQTNAKIDKSDAGKIMLNNLSISLPNGWKKDVPSSNMRVAQISYIENPAIEIAVFFFGEKDMANENIERWKGQFTKIDDFSTLKTENESIITVKIIGSLKKKAFPMAQEFTETPDQETLAAIVPSKSGPYYFKVSASKDEISSIEKDFVNLLNSLEIED